jgi:hypothetical protein
MLKGVERVEYDESRIVRPAVRIDKTAPILGLQRRAGYVGPQIDRCRGGQAAPLRQVIVEKQSGADHPCRAQMGGVRHDEAQRMHDMRRRPEQDFPFDECLAHEREVEILEVAKPAVNEFRAGRRSV